MAKFVRNAPKSRMTAAVHPKGWPRYVIATGIACLGLAVRFVLFPILQFSAPFIFAYLGVSASAYFLGLGPAVLVAALSGVGSIYFFI